MTSEIMQQAQLNLFRAAIKHHLKTENTPLTLKPSMADHFISLEGLFNTEVIAEFETWLEQQGLSAEIKTHFNPYESSMVVTPNFEMASIPSDLLTTEHLSFLAQNYEKEKTEIQEQAQNALMMIQASNMIKVTEVFMSIK